LHLVIYQGLTRRDLPHPGRNFTRPNTNVVNLAAEHRIKPRFRPEKEKHRGIGKLRVKIALITGGDSGIRRAVAIAFAKEALMSRSFYLEDHETHRKGSISSKSTERNVC